MKQYNQHSYSYEKNFYDYKAGKVLNPLVTQNYKIIQVADTFRNANLLYPDHRQLCDVEFTFVCLNSLDCSSNGNSCRVFENEIYIALKKELHSLKSTSSCKFLTIAFDFKKSSPYYPFLKSLSDYATQESRKIFLPEVQNDIFFCLSEVSNATKSKTDDTCALIDALLTKIIVQISRKQNNTAPLKQEHNDIANEAALFIDKNFLHITSLTEVADYIGYSYAHVSKLFQKMHNVSMRDYWLAKKMNYAKELLIKDRLSVTAIAETLQYSSLYNFSRAFKTHFGVYPTRMSSEPTEN